MRSVTVPIVDATMVSPLAHMIRIGPLRPDRSDLLPVTCTDAIESTPHEDCFSCTSNGRATVGPGFLAFCSTCRRTSGAAGFFDDADDAGAGDLGARLADEFDAGADDDAAGDGGRIKRFN